MVLKKYRWLRTTEENLHEVDKVNRDVLLTLMRYSWIPIFNQNFSSPGNFYQRKSGIGGLTKTKKILIYKLVF